MAIDSLGIQIGGLYIRYYGLIIVTGAIAAGYLAAHEAKRRKLDPNFVWDALMWTLLGGILGARLYHVITPPPSMMPPGSPNPYFQNPISILWIWKGGLGIPGGLVGGAFTLWAFSRNRNQPFALWADVASPGLLLAQSIGRWGNFINQELYGLPSELPWAIHIAPRNRVQRFAQYESFHPLFLYESVLNIMGCLILLWATRRYARNLQHGDIALGYFVIYPTIRFFLEFIRVDSSQVAGINANQSLMAVVAIVSALLLALRKLNIGLTPNR
ncbi:MAG: prolipoprotein diacylglyceryl transferase [Anaerolineales bacterium]|nr:prolipoprotein diacylglyceryl transferase [Anaerolineales bacterium]